MTTRLWPFNHGQTENGFYNKLLTLKAGVLAWENLAFWAFRDKSGVSADRACLCLGVDNIHYVKSGRF